MTQETQWLKWAHKIQVIAQAGLAYGKDVFDLERYRELQSIAAEMISTYTTTTPEDAADILAIESGYPTPKVDVRTVVFDDTGRLLMAREVSDGGWSLAGGWADFGDSAAEVAVREAFEETGYRVKPVKLLGLLDRNKHPHPAMFWHVYKVYIQCELIGGEAQTSIETSDVDFFDRQNIPPLSATRVTQSQIERLFAHYDNPDLQADFD